MREAAYRFDDAVFERSVQVIRRCGAVELIEGFARDVRGPGGRPRSGRRFTVMAVLVVALSIVRVGRTPSIAEILRMIGTLTPAQLVELGMDPDSALPQGGDEGVEPGEGDQALKASSSARHGGGGYAAFHGWLTRMLEPLDPGADLQAKRVTNGEHRRQLASRSEEAQQASETAERRLLDVVNALVAGSVDQQCPGSYDGDVIADETIVDLAGTAAGLGLKDDKRRAAAYMARYYLRDQTDNSVHSKSSSGIRLGKAAFGIGVTAVSRVGSPTDLYGIAPVITGVAIHHPSSGTVAELGRALEYHARNGFAPARGPGRRVPYLTTDMGYNNKAGFSDMVLDAGYAPVVRYPSHWKTVFASEGPDHTRSGQADGPVQISGEFYCPVAREMVGKAKLVAKTRDLLDTTGGFDAHDRRISQLFPLLMGTNSRPYRARPGRGRPRRNETSEQVALPVRQDLVCPAVQGRVQCPLKPASMDVADLGIPTVTPTWTAERYRCCSQSQVTVTMSARQWQRAQWGMVPGSWEHTLYFEAARAATEQRFSIMKSQHVTGIEHLKWSPRRQPMICLMVGLWLAATNLAIQEAHDQRPARPASVKRRLRQVETDLGRPLTRIPPRT